MIFIYFLQRVKRENRDNDFVSSDDSCTIKLLSVPLLQFVMLHMNPGTTTTSVLKLEILVHVQ